MATGYMLPLQATLQWFTDQGVILAGGQIYTYAAGTTTPATTYTDSTCTVPNANPITLGSNARLPASAWVTTGTVIKAVLTDSNGNLISGGTIDNMPGINDLGQATGTGVLTVVGASGVAAGTPAYRFNLISNVVALRIGGWSGTVTATAIYLEGIPSNLLPIVEQTFIIRTNVNGTYVAALAVIYPFAVNATGAMQIYPDIPGNLWTVGNTCGNPSDSTLVYEILP